MSINKNFIFLLTIFWSNNILTGIKDVIPGNLNPKEYPNLTQFIAQNRCSRTLEDHQDEHFLKGDQIDRIINAARAKRVIASEGLNSLYIPHKCLARNSAGDYAVLSERVPFQSLARRFSENKLCLSEAKELVSFTQSTGYTDWHAGNIGRTVDEKIAICDTEDRSFTRTDEPVQTYILIEHLYNSLRSDDDLPIHKSSTGLIQPLDWEIAAKIMQKNNSRNYGRCFKVDLEIEKWLKKKSQQSHTNQLFTLPLKRNSTYDDSGLNLEAVKQELSSYRSTKEAK